VPSGRDDNKTHQRERERGERRGRKGERGERERDICLFTLED